MDSIRQQSIASAESLLEIAETIDDVLAELDADASEEGADDESWAENGYLDTYSVGVDDMDDDDSE